MTRHLAIAACLLAAPTALAQPVAPAPAAATAPTAATTPATPVPVAPARPAIPPATDATPAPRRRGPRLIELDDVVVQGEVQKPEAFYILQRSELNFKGLEPDRSFIPLIIESVRKEPF